MKRSGYLCAMSQQYSLSLIFAIVAAIYLHFSFYPLTHPTYPRTERKIPPNVHVTAR